MQWSAEGRRRRRRRRGCNGGAQFAILHPSSKVVLQEKYRDTLYGKYYNSLRDNTSLARIAYVTFNSLGQCFTYILSMNN
jgi:hypothetical protein